MTDELYDMLGVPRDASPAAIQRAYRKLAKQHHPDQNPGDDSVTARYLAVNAAYNVLSDPVRREKYDRTGEVDSPEPDRTLAELMSVLAPVLQSVLQQMAKQGAKADRENIVEHMRTILRGAEADLKKSRDEVTKVKVMAEEAVDRFTIFEGEENLLAAAAQAYLAQVDAKLREIDREADRVKKAAEYLKKCGYKVEQVVAFFKMPTWATSSTATGGW